MYNQSLGDSVLSAAIAVLVMGTLILTSHHKRTFLDILKKQPTKKSEPPALAPFDSLGALFWNARLLSNDILQLLTLVRQGGSQVYSLPTISLALGRKTYAVADYKIARSVLADPASKKPYWGYKITDTAIGGANIFSAEGIRWKHARKASAPAFSLKAIQSVAYMEIERIVKIQIENVIASKVAKNEPIDIMREAQRVYVAAIAAALFEYNTSTEEVEGFINAVDAIYRSEIKKLNPFYSIFGFLCKDCRDGSSGREFLMDLAMKMIQNYENRALISTPDDEKDKTPTLISLLMNDDGYNSDQEMARDIFVFMSASYDTTAASTSFLFRELAKHKDYQDKLRTELQASSSAKNCPLLLNAIRETHRLYPGAATGPSRELGKDIEAGNGLLLAKGSIVISSFLCIHRNAHVFENPDDFHPERWNNPSHAAVQSLMPFAVGRRNCIGQPMAQEMTERFVSRLVKTYKMTIVEEGGTENVFIWKPKGLRLKFTKV